VAEISLLSAHRPVLSFLISMGAPAIWPTRIFEYNDPEKILTGDGGVFIFGAIHTWWIATAISVCQYIFAIGALANIVTTSVELGQKSILSWGCTTTFLPLLWTTLASFIHVIAATSHTLARSRRHPTQSGNTESLPSLKGRVHATSVAARSKEKPRLSFMSLLRNLTRAAKQETTICANHKVKPYHDSNLMTSHLAISFNVAAACLGFLHIVFGTLVFSSLQFITVWDVFNSIIWRYILSTVVCRVILIVELAGLRTSKHD
jgi:hypothetical protein